MTLYRVATLLEHEMLIGLANEILHSHRLPTFEELQQAHIFADSALRLAFEGIVPYPYLIFQSFVDYRLLPVL
jgi:hypothetical protein